MKQTLTIPDWLPESLANGGIHGMHWAVIAKRKRAAKLMVSTAAKEAGWQPTKTRAKLTITLVFSVHRKRDRDNLFSRCKPLVDAIKPYIVDDSMDWLDLVVDARVVKGTKEVQMTLEQIAGEREAA